MVYRHGPTPGTNIFKFIRSIKCSLFHTLMIVAKYGISKWPIFGSIARAFQAIFVERETDKSKGETMEQIKKRSSEEGWPQIVIFPGSTV